MSTPVSPTTPYCTASDFIKRYDVRSIGDRLQDAGVRVDSGSILADQNMAALLLQASGMLESALLRGQRYKIADIQLLVAGSLGSPTTGGEFVKGLVADLTLYLIYNRRVNTPMPRPAMVALETITALSGGERIFALDEAATAGMSIPIVAPNANQPVAPVLPVPITQRALDFFGDMNAGGNP
jgi:hypothetical protein